MRIFYTILTALCFLMAGKAGAAEYPAATIPAELLKNASVVKRFEDIKFEIISTSETVLTKKYVLTVLNEQGERYAVFEESYFDKLNSIKSIEGTLYDALGKELRTLKNKEIKDYSAISNFSIFDDNRVKQHSFGHQSYPYTVAYEVVIKFNHSYYFPPWVPQEQQGVSVEDSRYTLIHPEDYAVRLKAYNYSGAPTSNTAKGKKVQQWAVKNQQAISQFWAMPGWHELTTVLYLAPSSFEMEGYKGNMNTWDDFGKFQNSLNSGRDVLPDVIKQQVTQLCNGVLNPKEKVAKLYVYMQQNTRYISVQLGIGGWQPFEAAYVVKNGYGDCKALSNYMYALLKEADIRSHYAIVRAGDNLYSRSMLEDFPMPQFNHVVLCVPLEKDSVWLECTDQTIPAGYMGSFTGNRKALLVTEEGGKLAATPRYGVAENLQLRKIDAKLVEDGSLAVIINTRYTGTQQDDKQMLIERSTKEDVKKALNENLDLPSYEVVDFKYEQRKAVIPEIVEHLQLQISRYASISGKRIFITPNLLSQSGVKLSLDTARTADFVFDYEYKDADTLELELLDGYVPEALPQDVLLQTKYGRYSSSVKVINNRMMYLRTMEQYAGRFSVKEAADLKKFWDAIYKADRARVVLVKKE